MQNNPFEKIGHDIAVETHPQPVSLPLPGSNAYSDLPQFTKHGVLSFRRTIHRQELRQIVPLAEVEAWIEERKQSSRSGSRSTGPDVTLRRTRPVNGLIAVSDNST
ncbi:MULTISPECIES: hypothetical protein [Enterobacterales]|uniref:hypothetical protein n=1 Tax=Enterobacterales TaxID=91347 RepID=UPI001F48D39E|nr:hypothetical protein [Citrobacter freundii]